MHNRTALLLVFLVSIALAAHSQISISPYSYYGLGEPYGQSSARSFGMGQTGIGAYDGASINRLNPASYADLKLTTFDFNGLVAYSQQKSNYNTQNTGTSAFNHAGLGFSNRKGFGIVMGLAPYSTVGYEVETRDSILADTNMEAFTANYKGSGGLNQLYIGAGVRFLKRVQAGVNLGYAFGTTQHEYRTDWDNSGIEPGYAERRTTVRGLVPQFGLQYGDTLGFKIKVDRTKEIDQQQKELDGQIAALDAEKLTLEKEAAKTATWEAGKQAEADALAAEVATLETAVKGLMSDERGNAKEIGKLQDQIYRLEKKRKDIVAEIRARKKENLDAQASLKTRRDKLVQRKQALATEKTEIEAGKRENVATKSQRFLVRVGATYDLGSTLNGTQVIRFSNNGIVDTLNNDTGAVTLPSKLGFGFSIARANKWMIAADVSMQNWSQFAYFGNSDSLQSTLIANVGAEWIPEISSNKYARKIAYRLGGFYHQSMLNLQAQPIKEVGVTLGVGLPIGFYNPIGQSFSRINLGVSLSRRGTLEANLLQEMTVQFRLGVNLNDIWFIRRRID